MTLRSSVVPATVGLAAVLGASLALAAVLSPRGGACRPGLLLDRLFRHPAGLHKSFERYPVFH
jgi:hypothetical protein